MRTTYGVIVAIAAVAAVSMMILPAEATSACTTTDSTLLSTIEAKIVRHGTETGRADLYEMFTKSYNTMKGNDTYTTSDIKARADKQGSNWQGAGPNALWQSIYAELDRLETCRANTDTTPPVITMNGSATVTINKGDSYTDAGATCLDNTDGAISPVSSGTVDTTTAGSYTISYSCTDTAGNAATQITRSVTVQNPPDVTPPVITMNGNATVTINKGDSYTDAGATCTDDTDGAISPVSYGTVDTTTSGSYTISYSCADTAGNTATQLTRTVTVQNTPISQDTQPVAPQTPSENLVQNGSFEAPVVSGWSHVSSGTAGLVWTISGGPIEIHRGILGGASDGSQHIELDSTTSVTISQTISTISGQSYTVSFDYKARPDTVSSTNGIRVQWNGADIASGITFGNTWQTHNVTVTGTGSDTLSFMDMGTSDGLGTFLDNVSVVASDVPQTQQGGGPLFTGQSIQPGGGGTPTFVLFGIGVPAGTITEGGVANVTISTTPAPTTPLDAIVKVSSSSGHVNTANHTITIPTSGSAVFSVQTINTAEHKDGNILITIQDTNDYLVDGIGAVTIAIKDDPSTLYASSVTLTVPTTTVEYDRPFNATVSWTSTGTNIYQLTIYTHGGATPYDESEATISSPRTITINPDTPLSSGMHTLFARLNPNEANYFDSNNVTITVESPIVLTGPEALPNGHYNNAASGADNTASNDIYNMGFRINYDSLPANWHQGISNTDVTFQIEQSDGTWADIPKDAVRLMSGKNVLTYNLGTNIPSLNYDNAGLQPGYAVIHPSEIKPHLLKGLTDWRQTSNKPTLTGKLFTGGIHDAFEKTGNTIRVAFTYGDTTIHSNEVTFTLVNTKPVIKLNGPDKISHMHGSAWTEKGAICLDDFDADADVATGDISYKYSNGTALPNGIADTSMPGTYLVEYNCNDSESVAADPVTRTIKVEAKVSPWVERIAYGSTDRGINGALDEVTVNAGEQPHWVSITCANENGNRGNLPGVDKSKRLYKWSAQIVSSNVDISTPTHDAERNGISGKSAYYQTFACVEKDGTWGESRNRTVNVLPALDPYDHTDIRYQIKIGASQTQIKSGQSLNIAILSGTNSDWKRDHFEIRNVDVNQGFYAIDNPRGLGCGSINKWSVLSTIPLHLEAGNYEIRVVGDHSTRNSCGEGKTFAHSNSVKFTVIP